MAPDAEETTNGLPADARYCPSCGAELDPDAVWLVGDHLLNRYRASFACGACNYRGEIIREGGLEDLSSDPTPETLWCGQHNEYEPASEACAGAFDPDEVPWLVDEESDQDQPDEPSRPAPDQSDQPEVSSNG